MKLELKDLVKDKYYLCYVFNNLQYIFKYTGHDKVKIYSDFYITLDIANNEFHYYGNLGHFCEIGWYKRCEVFRECLIADIVYHLPKDNIDSINYFRQKKIDYLLNI